MGFDFCEYFEKTRAYHTTFSASEVTIIDLAKRKEGGTFTRVNYGEVLVYHLSEGKEEGGGSEGKEEGGGVRGRRLHEERSKNVADD